MEIVFNKSTKLSNIIICLSTKLEFLDEAQNLPKDLQDLLKSAFKEQGFKGDKGEVCGLFYVEKKQVFHVLALGVGDSINFKDKDLTAIGSKLLQFSTGRQFKKIAVYASFNAAIPQEEIASEIALAFALRNYEFLKYKTVKPPKNYTKPEELEMVSSKYSAAAKNFDAKKDLIVAVHFARDLISEPANILYPESFVERCSILKKQGVKLESLNVKEMTKLGMGALLGVGQGSSKESRLLILQWNGGKKSDKPLAFVGKGVCFDTGGISIKGRANLDAMKYDMSGGAAVAGLIYALAMRKAKVNVVGVIGLVENMPDGNAQRPGDIVKSMSGQTIEILDTDAEGRLVLADALWYTQDRFKPKFMVDLATLTGAISVALGVFYAGLFSNDDKLAKNIFKAGQDTGERTWIMPMGKEYDSLLDSEIADIRNLSKDANSGGSSIVAAAFLERFVNNVPWAHLDIANVANTHKANDYTPKGAVGFGVRLLNQLIMDNYE